MFVVQISDGLNPLHCMTAGESSLMYASILGMLLVPKPYLEEHIVYGCRLSKLPLMMDYFSHIFQIETLLKFTTSPLAVILLAVM